ncbi:putative secreted protein (Por secretion system target) [Breznakibacter xylanolyticus]|uniref:Putative secreted protein (Por secretion system target) n=1 Tax=Breznakibacter xylanolyticus TaxID=990 RepID=A0A2W7NW31_9BACT|nr:T9SS type A sorting domain-containing protein [Breznakibacter xylanolyticus]PZX20814.1 putative secreted protein (Por secretion system target) [Breznakibacter xylanolyticus]
MKKLATTLGCLVALAATSFSAMAQDDFTKGTNYYLIYLDEETELANLPGSKIEGDFRPNGSTHNLWIWGDTYKAPATSGPNWNGEPGAYLSFAVANAGWSGLGFNISETYDFGAITSDYTFHIAMKSTATNSHLLGIDAGTGNTGKICIGANDFVDGNITYKPYTNFPRDGKWHLIEIPMSEFFKSGLRYDVGAVNGTNVFWMLSGNNPGTVIDMDAIYIYKKTGGSSSVANRDGKQISMLVNQNEVTVFNTDATVEIFSLTGNKVKESNETSINCNDLPKGFYIVKSGSFSGKIQVK